MRESDSNQESEGAVRKATGTEKANGEDLLTSEELEIKERLRRENEWDQGVAEIDTLNNGQYHDHAGHDGGEADAGDGE